MDNTILVAVISMAGTLIGTLGGIVASGKLTAYRLEALERKVQAHNNLIERMYRVEGEVSAMAADIKELKGTAH